MSHSPPASRPRPASWPLRLSFAAATLLAAAAAAAAADGAPRVVASIKPVHSLVSAVMSGIGEPRLIVRGAASPHTFSLRPSDAAVLQEADIVFLIDEAMETSLAGAVGTLARHARVVRLSEAPGLVHRTFREGGAFEEHDDEEHHGDDGEHHGDDGEERHEEDDEEHDEAADHGPQDMHLWLDPVNARAMTRVAIEVLSGADPANAATYAANGSALLGRLDALTEEIAATVAAARGVPFIVFHDGYRHFEDRFGLAAVGSAVVSPARSPSARRIGELRDKVRALDAACVFDEPQFDRRVVDIIVEGTSARTGTVDPLGAAIGSGPEMYFALLRQMAAAFVACLAPE